MRNTGFLGVFLVLSALIGCGGQVNVTAGTCSEAAECTDGLVCCPDNICRGPGFCPEDGDAGGTREPDAGKKDAGKDTGAVDSGPDGDSADASGGDPDLGDVPDGGGDDVQTPDGGTADDGGGDTGSPCEPSPTGKGGPMCDVPAGAFMMGCNNAVDTECRGDESPYHPVSVPAFRIDRFEVTVGDYKACVAASACTALPAGALYNCNVAGKDNHPMNGPSWGQAKAYCHWAGKRLPTEAEWEKAARGLDGRKYPWGNGSLDCDHVVSQEAGCAITGTEPVGSKPLGASPYGAEDMLGNVMEWVEDGYHGSYTGAPSDGSAWADPGDIQKIVRGGAWDPASLTKYLRVSTRGGGKVGDYYDGRFGFRCAW